MPILPYREPGLINGIKDIPQLLKSHCKDHVMLVTDQGIRCNALIAFGGGSSIDCAKAVGARIVKPKQGT